MKKLIIPLSISLMAAFATHAEVDTNTILNSKCSSCHATPKADGYSKADWDQYMDKMQPFAQISDGEKQALKDLKK
ncbi:MAG: hypothetical protein ACK5MJ_03030 [Alphaproteobacteria bacterium]